LIENRKHAVEKGLHLCGSDCPWSVLTEENVRFIRSNNQMTIKELSEKFNVSRSTISNIIHYKTWKTVEKIC
jgi:DNA-binding transcriptional regulator YiaG